MARYNIFDNISIVESQILMVWKAKLVREAFGLKNVTKSGKSPHGGGGSAKNIKKSKIRNLDFLIRGGKAIFSFFSQIQMHTLDTSVEEKIS